MSDKTQRPEGDAGFGTFGMGDLPIVQGAPVPGTYIWNGTKWSVGPLPQPPNNRLAGSWYPVTQPSALTTYTAANQTMKMVPFIPESPWNIDRLAVDQTSAADATGIYRFALYQWSTTDPVWTQVADFGSIASLGLTGPTLAIGSGPASPYALAFGQLYAVAMKPERFTAQPTIQGAASGPTQAALYVPYNGAGQLGGINSNFTGYQVTGIADGTMPATVAKASLANVAGFTPVFSARAA